MKFAHFSHVWMKPGMTAHERYEQLWGELVACDELGFDFSFCVEHHFRPDESLMSSPSLYAVGGGARTKRLRLGSMGYIVPLYHPLRLAEEIAVVDQMLGGRFECGLVPGITASYFTPFGLEYSFRKSPTLEFVQYLRAAYGEKQPFSFHGDNHDTDSALLAVQPAQRPHPPLWMMSRDPETLTFCAENGINTGYFLIVPRKDTAPRYRRYFEQWQAAGHDRKPNIAYSTVVYVDESDEKALEVARHRASRAYEGFLPQPIGDESFQSRVARFADVFSERKEPATAKLVLDLFNPDYILENELMFVGSPKTVAEKLHRASEEGFFNTFMGEFNFANLPEEDLMRSIRLFGTKVMPKLRGYEPF